jgi:DNA-directed RNA polymerase subunit M/transcription elongation factor TFIIS
MPAAAGRNKSDLRQGGRIWWLGEPLGLGHTISKGIEKLKKQRMKDNKVTGTTLPKSAKIKAFGQPWGGKDHSSPTGIRGMIRRLLCAHAEVTAFKADTSDMSRDNWWGERDSLFVECKKCGRRWRIPRMFSRRPKP